MIRFIPDGKGGIYVDRRIIIFTGKGGVGKSSVAAAHAIKSASQGKNTLLVSTDMAHNLGDIFEQKLGREICNIRPNLDLYEIDPQYVMENDFEDIMKALSDEEHPYHLTREELEVCAGRVLSYLKKLQNV